MKKLLVYLFSTSLVLAIISNCTSEKGIPDYNGFPAEVGKIVFTKCAVAGCHTDKSKDAAGGLSLESWDKLFEGGRNSVAVIPFRSDFSTFCYYINTYADLGVSLEPTMPFNKEVLSREQVILLSDWINSGAPNADGFVKFSDNPARKKYYVTNQGCDVVTVFDQESMLPMRYVNVGSTAGTESPHYIRVSPDNKYWYVLSLTGTYLEKYSASDDSFVGKSFIGNGNWNTFVITSNSQTAYCIDLSGGNQGRVATVNLSTMAAANVQAGFNFPHGSALNKTDDTLYVTQQYWNKLYKIPVADFSAYSEINLYTSAPSPTLNPHEIAFTPDGTKYFVTCQGSSDVRVFQTSNDQLLATIPAVGLPAEMVFSTSNNYLFITCTEDTLNFPGKRGSVAVIDYQSNSFVKYIYTGHQPHGIGIDESKGVVVIANRNATNEGPAPHHSTNCGGRNGYVTFIDMNTLELIPSGNSDKRIEVAVDPYSVSIRN